MSQYPGYLVEQKYRVAWRVKATGQKKGTGSMTRAMAIAWKDEMAARNDGIEYWIEQYNGYEWERV